MFNTIFLYFLYFIVPTAGTLLFTFISYKIYVFENDKRNLSMVLTLIGIALLILFNFEFIPRFYHLYIYLVYGIIVGIIQRSRTKHIKRKVNQQTCEMAHRNEKGEELLEALENFFEEN